MKTSGHLRKTTYTHINVNQLGYSYL